jgi:DNA-binding transcriptional ArsR family regulator
MEKTEETCIRGCANVNLINRSIQELSELDRKIHQVSTILGLAGNETRLKILLLIKKEKKVCVCDLSDILGISISAVSQQLSKLRNGGILISSKEGQTIYYFIAPNFINTLDHIFELFNHKSIKKVA